MDEIQLTLTIDEINKILETLGSRPYAEVFQLVAKIQHQAEGQLQPPATAESEETDG